MQQSLKMCKAGKQDTNSTEREYDVRFSNVVALSCWSDPNCDVECNPGFWLSHNDINCTEFGDKLGYSYAGWVGSAICSPKLCGVPSEQFKDRVATVTSNKIHYPESAQFQCSKGYTFNGNFTLSTEENQTQVRRKMCKFKSG